MITEIILSRQYAFQLCTTDVKKNWTILLGKII